jgi:quercetin dioxygenase-like cupin family protein
MENTLKPIMENDRVRVLKVTFKPGETAAKHHHTDHLIYVINGGTLKLTVEGKVSNVYLKTGEAVF